MRRVKSLVLFIVLASSLLGIGLSTGCSSSQKLDPAGVYQGDSFLYNAENTINNAHGLFHEFLTWEFNFRQVLPPEVSRAADHIRKNEPKWLNSAHAFRDAYVATPTPQNKDKLQLSLNLIRTGLSEAAFYMSSAKSKAPNAGLRGVPVPASAPVVR